MEVIRGRSKNRISRRWPMPRSKSSKISLVFGGPTREHAEKALALDQMTDRYLSFMLEE